MKLLDLTLSSPAENLACEETLLDTCDESGGEEILRFWAAREPFVVVGYANKIATEVNVAACAAKGIPIFRRCSGGGTVFQGPGCLNYALVLRITDDGPCRTITSANRFIMEKNRAAIETLLLKSEIGNRKSEILVSGHTDLALNGRKFSGNSQRRQKKFLLFHGTFLLNFNLTLVSEFLRMPSLQPDYRASRSHVDFLANLNLPADQVKAALRKAWSATEEFKAFSNPEVQKLVAQKYSTDAWNLKF
jgi:lipoate---protein ligase